MSKNNASFKVFKNLHIKVEKYFLGKNKVIVIVYYGLSIIKKNVLKTLK